MLCQRLVGWLEIEGHPTIVTVHRSERWEANMIGVSVLCIIFPEKKYADHINT